MATVHVCGGLMATVHVCHNQQYNTKKEILV